MIFGQHFNDIYIGNFLCSKKVMFGWLETEQMENLRYSAQPIRTVHWQVGVTQSQLLTSGNMLIIWIIKTRDQITLITGGNFWTGRELSNSITSGNTRPHLKMNCDVIRKYCLFHFEEISPFLTTWISSSTYRNSVVQFSFHHMDLFRA